MNKFIEFNGSVFNIRHIIAVCKCKRDCSPQYGISVFVTGDIDRQWFNEEYERDSVFNQLSRELLNE